MVLPTEELKQILPLEELIDTFGEEIQTNDNDNINDTNNDNNDNEVNDQKGIETNKEYKDCSCGLVSKYTCPLGCKIHDFCYTCFIYHNHERAWDGEHMSYGINTERKVIVPYQGINPASVSSRDLKDFVQCYVRYY